MLTDPDEVSSELVELGVRSPLVAGERVFGKGASSMVGRPATFADDIVVSVKIREKWEQAATHDIEADPSTTSQAAPHRRFPLPKRAVGPVHGSWLKVDSASMFEHFTEYVGPLRERGSGAGLWSAWSVLQAAWPLRLHLRRGPVYGMGNSKKACSFPCWRLNAVKRPRPGSLQSCSDSTRACTARIALGNRCVGSGEVYPSAGPDHPAHGVASPACSIAATPVLRTCTRAQ